MFIGIGNNNKQLAACVSLRLLETWITARHYFSHSQVLWEDEDDTLGHTLVAQEGPSVALPNYQHYSNVMSLTGPPHQTLHLGGAISVCFRYLSTLLFPPSCENNNNNNVN